MRDYQKLKDLLDFYEADRTMLDIFLTKKRKLVIDGKKYTCKRTVNFYIVYDENSEIVFITKRNTLALWNYIRIGNIEYKYVVFNYFKCYVLNGMRHGRYEFTKKGNISYYWKEVQLK